MNKREIFERYIFSIYTGDAGMYEEIIDEAVELEVVNSVHRRLILKGNREAANWLRQWSKKEKLTSWNVMDWTEDKAKDIARISWRFVCRHLENKTEYIGLCLTEMHGDRIMRITKYDTSLVDSLRIGGRRKKK